MIRKRAKVVVWKLIVVFKREGERRERGKKATEY
ncbi:hypothetical protein SAMN05216390_1602 [Lachnospiraceae bacterium KH1T2]|nr:hypothetical protein SAMN05216390_1602 [Lachnospiraceae bacterium KH1T2]